ncbi:Hypothetical_protein [Hexamita inflata]|uniref:Hypothetical_protein n=1 Tax=Hexamita inflata TaxID=28002 RepID=A0AA86NPM2_9EUKA|nr:Hypothetical protein HINF_LOCUS10894 [Hexamita inflata]
MSDVTPNLKKVIKKQEPAIKGVTRSDALVFFQRYTVDKVGYLKCKLCNEYKDKHPNANLCQLIGHLSGPCHYYTLATIKQGYTPGHQQQQLNNVRRYDDDAKRQDLLNLIVEKVPTINYVSVDNFLDICQFP